MSRKTDSCLVRMRREARAASSRRSSSAAARVPGLGSTMTGLVCSARSSSDAPVCASLERAASAKCSPLLARVADNHQRSRLWTAARYLRTQRLDGRHTCRVCGHTADSGGGILGNVSWSISTCTHSRQPLCMQIKGGLLSAAEEDT